MSEGGMDKESETGGLMGRATSTAHLETRLQLNRQASAVDFNAWLFARLGIQKGMTVLDVGCGTGAQALRFLELVGPDGSVSALDIAAESVATLRERAGDAPQLETAVADMAALARVIETDFHTKRFDLAHSSYALYYSPERIAVLDAMRDHITAQGRVAIFTPNGPHGMVELVRRFAAIPQAVDESLAFGPTVLEPYFRANFWDVTVHFFHNEVRLTAVEDFMTFYRATTYYDAQAEPDIEDAVRETIARDGHLTFEKNGYLIIGSSVRERGA